MKKTYAPTDDLTPAQNETEALLLDTWREAFDAEWFRASQHRMAAAKQALTDLFRGHKTRRLHDGVILHASGRSVQVYRVIRDCEAEHERRLEASYSRKVTG